MNIPNKIKIYFDGSCLPVNPGGTARFGWQILDFNENELFTDQGEVCKGEEATNNVAEWAALRNALLFLKNNNWNGELEIYGDSQLVIRQLVRQYRVKKPSLILYFNECLILLQGIKWSAEWIPREKNQRCDDLSKGQ